MKNFRDKLAVITGGGTGMGRALAEQLTAEGCHVAICDVSGENMAETKGLCEARARSGTRISTHGCDVSDERQVVAFRNTTTAPEPSCLSSWRVTTATSSTSAA